MDIINQSFKVYFSGYSLSQTFRNGTLRIFINNLPKIKIVEAMEHSCGKMASKYNNIEYAAKQSIKYFCGICWNWIKHPETRDW